VNILQTNIKFLIIFSDEHDLQTAIKVPFEDPQLYFDSGEDGFPAFGIKPGSDIKSPYRLFLPEKLYSEFSIVVNFKLNSMDGGFLFAVVNPLENVSMAWHINTHKEPKYHCNILKYLRW